MGFGLDRLFGFDVVSGLLEIELKTISTIILLMPVGAWYI